MPSAQHGDNLIDFLLRPEISLKYKQNVNQINLQSNTIRKWQCKDWLFRLTPFQAFWKTEKFENIISLRIPLPQVLEKFIDTDFSNGRPKWLSFQMLLKYKLVEI